ncbi:MAG: phytoene desaturase family protein, partial [Chloroflexota bacterium]
MTRDAVIIGGGHNGLVAAAYLAKAGLDVLVLERRDVLGGAAVTEELWPGYRVSTAAYLVSLLQEKVVQDLQLARHGYEILPKDPPYFSPRLDGQHFFMWRDMAKTCQELARLSPRDAERYPAYEEMLDRVTEFVEPLLLAPPPGLPIDDPEAVADWAAFMGRLHGLPRKHLAEVIRVFTASVSDFLDDWFESDALKAALATDGVIGAAAGPRTPGTAYVLLHHMMGRAAGSRGLWGFARGGTGAVSRAIASAAQEAGTEIRTGVTVERVLVEQGRAVGVVLAGGDEIRARVVVSNADPKRTFLGLVGRDHLPSDLA